MPLDRLFHAVAGHSEKVNKLTDLEYRVWTQYLLSADDFGVMRLSAAPIQADNDRLSEVSTRKVQAALEKLVEIDLLSSFEHQGKRFVYQWNWQKYQKVEYPRTTTMPKPSDVSGCDRATAWLFGVHPGGKRLPKDTQAVAEELPTTSQEVAALTRAHAHPTANANGQRLEANGQRLTAVVPIRSARGSALMGGGSYAMHAKHGACNDRGLCVPQFLHAEFVGKASGDEAHVRAFYESVLGALPPDAIPGEDALEFWRAAWKKAHGSSEKKGLVSRMSNATADFVKAGQQ